MLSLNRPTTNLPLQWAGEPATMTGAPRTIPRPVLYGARPFYDAGNLPRAIDGSTIAAYKVRHTLHSVPRRRFRPFDRNDFLLMPVQSNTYSKPRHDPHLPRTSTLRGLQTAAFYDLPSSWRAFHRDAERKWEPVLCAAGCIRLVTRKASGPPAMRPASS